MRRRLDESPGVLPEPLRALQRPGEHARQLVGDDLLGEPIISLFGWTGMAEFNPGPTVSEGVRLILGRRKTVAVEDVPGLVAEAERPMSNVTPVE